MIKIGDRIPDFVLEGFYKNKIKKIKYSDLKKKWLVLLFYPADFTFVCPTELEDAAEYYPNFLEEGAEIMSVSTDTVYSHLAWHNESPSIKKIRFSMLADPTGKFCREMGTYIEDEGLSLRGTFIVDPKGLVKSIEIHDNSIGRNILEILRKFRAAKYTSEHKNEVCPARWKPGGKTLRPGEKLVGKI